MTFAECEPMPQAASAPPDYHSQPADFHTLLLGGQWFLDSEQVPFKAHAARTHTKNVSISLYFDTVHLHDREPLPFLGPSQASVASSSSALAGAEAAQAAQASEASEASEAGEASIGGAIGGGAIGGSGRHEISGSGLDVSASGLDVSGSGLDVSASVPSSVPASGPVSASAPASGPVSISPSPDLHRLLWQIRAVDAFNFNTYLLALLRAEGAAVPLDAFYNLLYNDTALDRCMEVRACDRLDRRSAPGRFARSVRHLRAVLAVFAQPERLQQYFPRANLGECKFASINIHEVRRLFLALKLLTTTLVVVENPGAGAVATIPRHTIYKVYYFLCQTLMTKYPTPQHGGDRSIVMGHSKLGKLLKLAFPQLRAKRLGRRGESKYNYLGVVWNEAIVDRATLAQCALDLLRLQEHVQKLVRSVVGAAAGQDQVAEAWRLAQLQAATSSISPSVSSTSSTALDVAALLDMAARARHRHYLFEQVCVRLERGAGPTYLLAVALEALPRMMEPARALEANVSFFAARIAAHGQPRYAPLVRRLVRLRAVVAALDTPVAVPPPVPASISASSFSASASSSASVSSSAPARLAAHMAADVAALLARDTTSPYAQDRWSHLRRMVCDGIVYTTFGRQLFAPAPAPADVAARLECAAGDFRPFLARAARWSAPHLARWLCGAVHRHLLRELAQAYPPPMVAECCAFASNQMLQFISNEHRRRGWDANNGVFRRWWLLFSFAHEYLGVVGDVEALLNEQE